MKWKSWAESYLRWKKDVAEHDYAAASSYLSIRFGQDHADQVAAKLRKLRRYAIVAIVAVAAVITPSSDPCPDTR